MTTTTYNSWTAWVVDTFVSKNPSPTALDISKLKAQISALRKMEESHFLDSENAGRELEDTTETLEHNLVALETAKSGYPLIRLDFLSETDQNGLPAYTIQDVTDRYFEVSVMPRNKSNKNPHRMDWGKTDDKTPDFDRTEFDFFSNTIRSLFGKFYQSAIKKLAEISVNQKDWEQVRIRSKSEGVVYPTKTRAKIQKAGRYFDNIYAIYRSPSKWDFVETSTYSPTIGILVGVIDNQFFFVDEFATVKTSDYLAAEVKKVSAKGKKTK